MKEWHEGGEMSETHAAYAVVDLEHLSAAQVQDLRLALSVFSPYQLARMAGLLNEIFAGTGFGEIRIVIENRHLSRIVTQESNLFPPVSVEVK